MPQSGSIGAVTAAVTDALARLGCRLERYDALSPGGAEQFLPLDAAKLQSHLIASSPLDIALYDDPGLGLVPPSRRWARKNVVLYHGLAYNQGSWVGNAEVDLHCGNSPYLADVLRTILSFPDWERRTCLDPRAFGIVADVRLMLPCVEQPAGSLAPYGATLPDTVRRALGNGETWGHALQGGKHDWEATIAILAAANEIARDNGAPPVRLLVPDRDIAAARGVALPGMPDIRIDDLVLPVSSLSQRALFEAMRACRFGLAYNTIPESFGFYALESVFNGCPVYANGAGNTRHALPPDHGITVIEHAAMTPKNPGSYRPVAQRLLDDLDKPAETEARCRHGAAFIRENHDRGAMERSLRALLARIDRAPVPDVPFDQLELRLSPLVRCQDRQTGVVVTDLRRVTLEPDRAARLEDLLGRRCGDVMADRAFRADEMAWFFENGILALAPPGGAAV
jgi:hypothetical protein